MSKVHGSVEVALWK